VSNRADSRDLIAIVCGDRIRVERDAAGRFRLPNLPDTDGWANPADLVTLAADPSAVIAAPAIRLLAEPKTTLHLVVIDRAGSRTSGLHCVTSPNWLSPTESRRRSSQASIGTGAQIFRTGGRNGSPKAGELRQTRGPTIS
jgi:hypothetical protein